MDFSKDYLYRGFEDNFKAAVAAKEKGNLALAKQYFTEAGKYMELLAKMSTGTERQEKEEKAARLKAIADAIVPEVRKDQPRNYSGSGANSGAGSGTGSGGYTPKTNLSPTYSYEDDDFEDEELDDEMSTYISFFDVHELEFGFEGVIGLEKAKEAVREYVINPILYPDAYDYRFADNKAVLLEGPPGTGKTTFAKAVAKEVNQPFVLVNVAALVNCYIGETAKNIDKVFAWLRDFAEKRGCGITVFFDELDEIAKKRGGDDKASASSVPALLRNLDGVKRNKGFLILANTNCPEMLDSGIIDRFRKRIHIPLPDKAMRKSFFQSKLSEVEKEFLDELDFDAFAEASVGLSGRAITYICDDFKYFLSASKAGLRKDKDFNAAMLDLIAESSNSKYE